VPGQVRHSKATFLKAFQPGTLDSACPRCFQFSKKLCRVLKPESTGTMFHISAHPSDVLVGALGSCPAGLPFNPALCGITISLLKETEMLSGRLKPHLGGLPTVMSKWKWLFGNDSGCKSPIEMATRFSHLCQDRTKVPICWKLWYFSAINELRLTGCDDVSVITTYGTLLTEHRSQQCCLLAHWCDRSTEGSSSDWLWRHPARTTADVCSVRIDLQVYCKCRMLHLSAKIEEHS
jgi:hypothetical protein